MRRDGRKGANQMEPILRTENLTIRFGGHTAVDHVNFEMPAKHFKSIIGPNGAGKTTFFNLISGELKANGRRGLFQRRTFGKFIRGFKDTERNRPFVPNYKCLSEFDRFGKCPAGCPIKGKNPLSDVSSFHQLSEIDRKSGRTVRACFVAGKEYAIASQLSHGEKRKLEIAMLLGT